MYWFWSEIYTTLHYTIQCKISKLYDDDVLYSLHSTGLPPLHSPCHRLLTTAASQMSRWLSCVRCWLLFDRCHIGCHNEKKISPNSNTTQYLQILPSTHTQLPNASIVLTLFKPDVILIPNQHYQCIDETLSPLFLTAKLSALLKYCRRFGVLVYSQLYNIINIYACSKLQRCRKRTLVWNCEFTFSKNEWRKMEFPVKMFTTLYVHLYYDLVKKN